MIFLNIKRTGNRRPRNIQNLNLNQPENKHLKVVEGKI